MEQKNWRLGLLTLITLAALGLSIAAFQHTATPTQTTGDTLTRIRKTGVIEACTVISPPFSIKNAGTGALNGYLIELMEEIASRIDAKVNWHESTWGNASADLQSRRCDVVAAEFFANIPRAQAVAFTEPPLFYIGNSAIIRKDDTRFQNVIDIFEFDKPDITVAVATGEGGDVWVRENFTQAQINRIDVEASDLTRFALEVSAGRADVAIAGADVIDIYVPQHPEVINLFAAHPFGLNPTGWAVRQEDEIWRHFLETTLIFLDTQGVQRELEQKYDIHVLQERLEFYLP